MCGVRLACPPAVLTRNGTDELSRSDSAPHSLLGASRRGDQSRMGGCPARHGSSMRPGSVELPGEGFGPEADLADAEAPIAGSDLAVEAREGLLEPAPRAGLGGGHYRARQIPPPIGGTPGLLARPHARLAVDRTAVGHPRVSVEGAERLYLSAGRASLRPGRSTIGKNQPLYNGLLCMHLGVLRRGLRSKRAVGEPPGTRTQNRLIKSSLGQRSKGLARFRQFLGLEPPDVPA